MKNATIFTGIALVFTTTFVSAQSNTPCTSGSPSAPILAVNSTCTYTSGTTVGATSQTNAANGGTPSCGSMGEDVWYRIVAPASGSITINTTAGSITDGVMALYSGTCGAFTELACEDDVNGLMPAITQTGLTPGATYYIRFWEYGGGTGTFNICVQSITISSGGNNTVCGTPDPICSGSPIVFVANTGSPAASTLNPGNNYGCLSTSPNPSWYYLEIDQSGNLAIDITAGSDVDFALWGPFASLSAATSACNSYGASVDCSYSTSAIEQANAAVVAGQTWVLLVTNYANTVQTISINEAGSNTASTNCAIVPLPVGYTQWDAQYIDRKAVLTWATDIEEDNEQFIVQRSADGLVWETIGAVAGNGNSSQDHDYQYIDEKPMQGISYYRLMQLDFNGTVSYTSILSINTEKTERFSVYPNPAKNSFNVLTGNKNIEQMTISNAVGQTFDVAYTKTESGLSIDCSELAAGIYTLTLVSGNSVQTERIAIAK